MAFRFGFLLGVLFVWPFPINLFPPAQRLTRALVKPFEWLTTWFGDAVLGIDASSHPTGSGDTRFDWTSMLVMLVLAGLGTVAWSVLDRRRTAYPRLAAGSVVVLRYVLASTMLSYGFLKFCEGQFPHLSPPRLEERVGEMSPMGMLWTFMGASGPYAAFAGLLECLAGVLLLWRRTATIGALISVAVMTNVVMLNLSYDVPVKLLSMQLVLVGLVIVLPDARRIIGALLGHATRAVPPRPRMSPRHERLRVVAKLILLATIVYAEYTQLKAVSDFAQPTELDATWRVETWSADGIEHPPLITDGERWRRVSFGSWMMSIRFMTDERKRYGLEVHPETSSLDVVGETTLTWHYTRSGDHLVLDGSFEGKRLHVTLVKEPAPLLVTRGFHLVQELPFNR